MSDTHDVTANLRSADKDFRDRVRWLAGTIYERAISDRGMNSAEELQRLAKYSIEAACVFWQEWEIAAMTDKVDESEKLENL